MTRIASAAPPSRRATSAEQPGSRLRDPLSADPERLPSTGAYRAALSRTTGGQPQRAATRTWARHPGSGRRVAACRLLQSPRFPSTTARPTPCPRPPRRRVPPCAAARGRPWHRWCQTGQTFTTQGPTGSDDRASTSPYDDSPESFAPNRSARTPLVATTCPTPGWILRTQSRGHCPHALARGRRSCTIRSRTSAPLPPAKKVMDRSPEVPSVQQAAQWPAQ